MRSVFAPLVTTSSTASRSGDGHDATSIPSGDAGGADGGAVDGATADDGTAVVPEVGLAAAR